MGWRQIYVLKSLFAAANSSGAIDKDVAVLHDAPPEDVAFMNQLIKEGSVVAYRPKRKGYRFNCFVFGGFTEKGLRAYWPIVEAELKAKRQSNGTGVTELIMDRRVQLWMNEYQLGKCGSELTMTSCVRLRGVMRTDEVRSILPICCLHIFQSSPIAN